MYVCLRQKAFTFRVTYYLILICVVKFLPWISRTFDSGFPAFVGSPLPYLAYTIHRLELLFYATCLYALDSWLD